MVSSDEIRRKTEIMKSLDVLRELSSEDERDSGRYVAEALEIAINKDFNKIVPELCPLSPPGAATVLAGIIDSYFHVREFDIESKKLFLGALCNMLTA